MNIIPYTGADLAALRTAAGVKQADLAPYMGIAGNTLSQWERPDREIDAQTIKLAVRGIRAVRKEQDGAFAGERLRIGV